jgi:hypothetical protein
MTGYGIAVWLQDRFIHAWRAFRDVVDRLHARIHCFTVTISIGDCEGRREIGRYTSRVFEKKGRLFVHRYGDGAYTPEIVFLDDDEIRLLKELI